MAVPEKRHHHEKALGESPRTKRLSIVPVDKIPKASPVLLESCSLPELFKTFYEMEMLCDILQGVGLHAVQVGLPLHMYVVRKDAQSPFRYCLNCSYQPLGDDKMASFEGCLSLKNLDGTSRYFRVNRYSQIRVTGQELLTDGKLRIEALSIDLSEEDGIICVAHQHEIDHATGVTIKDIGIEQHIFV